MNVAVAQVFAFFFFTCLSLLGMEEDPPISKSQIFYLAQTGQIDSSLELYGRYREALGKHDFEVLTGIALILLEQGAHSSNPQNQLLSIYGSGIASVAASLDVLESGIKSEHPEVQLASIQFISQMQEDRSDELLLKAMSSNFLLIRLEAAHQLSIRKHRASVGHIESLMYRVPPPLRSVFPQFFGLIGTSDAISILRSLMEDPDLAVRIEAVLSAARFERDDLLPSIRVLLTHVNVAEQEAAAYAIGLLKDSKSLHRIKKLLRSSDDSVQITAARCLLEFGDASAKKLLLEKARNLNLFAIAVLGEIKEGADLLAMLCQHSDLQVRMNAAIALVKLRDVRCQKVVKELLINDMRDLGFQPIFSLGKSLTAWKAISSASQQQKNLLYNIEALSFSLRQELLKNAIELPEKEFLLLAEAIFANKQSDLIPLLIELLVNRQTEGCFELLKQKAQQVGAPLIRGYANLALYRLQIDGPYGENVKTWMTRNKGEEMIFKPLTVAEQTLPANCFELTPEDSSRLLIECTQVFADRHEGIAIDPLLEMIRFGNPKNRCVLAGFLLRILQ